jgi:hypothetical protein
MSALVPAAESAPLWGWERIRALVLASVTSVHSRRAYAHALDSFGNGDGVLAPELAASVIGVKGSRQKGSRLGAWLGWSQKTEFKAR